MDSEKRRDLQKTFLHDEIWLLSFIGAFGRANIYSKNVTEAKKKKFREYLQKAVGDVVQQKYKNPVSSEQHIQELCRIQKAAEMSEHSSVLLNGEFRLGIVQKLVNLYLKYLWCLEWVEEPPHCPFDRNIIQKLELDVNVEKNWTTIIKVEDYEKLVVAAQKKAGPHSIAEWELMEFNRTRKESTGGR